LIKAFRKEQNITLLEGIARPEFSKKKRFIARERRKKPFREKSATRRERKKRMFRSGRVQGRDAKKKKKNYNSAGWSKRGNGPGKGGTSVKRGL